MKIVCAGPSGSGKTTLAKAIAKELNLKFIENSAGLVMLPEDKESLKNRYMYTGAHGQKGVINQSHLNPSFGFDFQYSILRARTKLLAENDNIVLDRSPLDPIVFYLNQVAHNQTQFLSESFIESAAQIFLNSGITHLIRIPLLNPERTIEDDNSRVPNWYFQKKVDYLFDLAIELVGVYFEKNLNLEGTIHGKGLSLPKVHRVNTWDWERRFQTALAFVSRPPIKHELTLGL
jgi:thymidylate kinase